MKRTRAMVGLALALGSAAIGFLYVMERGPFAARLELDHARFYAIKAEIQRTTQPVVVLGDSLVQGATLPSEICGQTVVNAGVVGAGVEYFDRHAAELLGVSSPKLIVLAVGVNDATSTDREEKFSVRYHKLVAWLSQRAPVSVATIAPVRSGPISISYDATQVSVFNEAIKQTKNAKVIIDLNQALSAQNWTTDGVHLGPDGYTRWTSAMIEGVKASLACRE